MCYEQEAQRAAEKAFDVGKVDERVKKAVAAANKSANAARVAAVKAVQNQMHLSNNNDETEIPSVWSSKTFHHQHHASTTKSQPTYLFSVAKKAKAQVFKNAAKMIYLNCIYFSSVFAVNSPFQWCICRGYLLGTTFSHWSKWLIVEQVGYSIFLASIMCK